MTAGPQQAPWEDVEAGTASAHLHALRTQRPLRQAPREAPQTVCILEVHGPKSWESGQILRLAPPCLASRSRGQSAVRSQLLPENSDPTSPRQGPTRVAWPTSSCVDGSTDGSTLSLSSPSGHHSPHSTRAQCSPKTQVLHTC